MKLSGTKCILTQSDDFVRHTNEAYVAPGWVQPHAFERVRCSSGTMVSTCRRSVLHRFRSQCSAAQDAIDTSGHPSKSDTLLLKSQAVFDAVVPKIIE